MARLPKPTLSPKLIRDIAEFFFDGFSNDDVSFYFKIPLETVASIRQGEIARQIRQKVIERKRFLIAKLRDGKKPYAGIIWFLERRYPQEFSKPETQLGFASGSITNNTLVVSAEAAEALLARSKPLDEELDRLLQQRALASSSSTASVEPVSTSPPVSCDASSHVSRLAGELSERDSFTSTPALEGAASPVPPAVPLAPAIPSSGKNPEIPDSSGKNPKKSTFSVKKGRGRPKKKV